MQTLTKDMERYKLIKLNLALNLFICVHGDVSILRFEGTVDLIFLQFRINICVKLKIDSFERIVVVDLG